MSTTLSNPSASVSSSCNIQSGVAPVIISTTPKVAFNPAPSVGSTAGNVNCCISEAFSVANGTPVTINVLTGADPLGNTAAMVHLVEIIITTTNTTSGQDLTVGGGTHPCLGTDQFTVQAGTAAGNNGGAFIYYPTGMPIVTSSSDTLTLTAAAGTVTGSILIKGRTA